MSAVHTPQLEEILEFEARGLASPTAVAEPLAGTLQGRGLVLVDVRGVVLRSETPPLARYVVTARRRGERCELAVIGKGLTRGWTLADLERVFGLMRVLWDGEFGRDPCLTIAEPFAVIADPPTLLQAEVPGDTLERWLDDPLSALGTVRRAARWLAKLHALDPGVVPAAGSVDEAGKLRACAARIGSLCPRFRDRSRTLTARLTALLDELAHETAVLTHGDFQAGNILITGDRLAAIDFDHAALAPPARDLGYFAAQALTRMYTRTGSMTTGCPWVAALREEYAHHRPGGDRGFSAYVARTILEALYYRLGKSPAAALPLVPVWLEWGEETLSIAERELR